MPEATILPSSQSALPRREKIPAAIAKLYQRVEKVIPEAEWDLFAPDIAAIWRWKKKKNAIILAHNYMTPEIYHCVADFVGDSLQLAIEASRTKADVIVQCGVHFMAETAKLMSPDKTVLLPDSRAGCSLAAAITGHDVELLRAKYPGLPVVTYVNTSAEVKAKSDICCTSANALQVVESFATDRVIMIPDQYLAKNIAAQTNKKIITWAGSCEVHERFCGEEIREYRQAWPGIVVLAHPECPPDVIAEADFSGSTSAMIGFVKQRHPKRVVMVTECSMSDNVAAEIPDTDFIRPCNLCPHMKRISLKNILHSLKTGKEEITIDQEIADAARQSVERMIALGASSKANGHKRA